MENNKKRAAGSGTTSGPRRERRQAIQWSALQQADQPVSSPAEMEKQLAALKKATESAEKQLKELEKADKQAKRASSRSGKHGPRTEKAAETLKETLKKAPGNKPKLVSLEQIQKEQALEAKLASLKKELEKKMPATKSSSSSADPNSLKKEEDPIAAGTEKKEESSLKKEGKPVVVVDWHNCLEKDDVVPEENLHALKKVLEVADVRIISWVGTEARRKAALKQIRGLLPAETLKKVKGYQCVWYRCGEGGKVDWACHYKAEAVFDDHPAIVEEAREWGILPFATGGNKPHKGGGGFWSFAEAAESYLKKFDM